MGTQQQHRCIASMYTAASWLLLTAALVSIAAGRPHPAALHRAPLLEGSSMITDTYKPRTARVRTASIASTPYNDGSSSNSGSNTAPLAPESASDSLPPAKAVVAPEAPSGNSSETPPPPANISSPAPPPCSTSSTPGQGINNGTSNGTIPMPDQGPCNPADGPVAPGNGGEGNATNPGLSPLPDPSPSPSPSPSPPPPPPNPCEPTVYESPVPQGVPIPPLSAGQKPNFIVILTDDQGWDDIGLHNPEWVKTPNLDRFIRSATKFDNFYTTPQCAPSRAMILTGRDYARTGTLLVNAGYDSINSDEVTAGEFMSAAGYSTAQFGKWHNGQEMGYEPWNAGFKESWNVPISMVAHIDPIFVHNGEYVQTHGYLEDIMADKLTSYLDDQAAEGEPFFVYYATHSIHTGKLQYRGNYSDPWKGPGGEGDDEGFSGEAFAQLESGYWVGEESDSMFTGDPFAQFESAHVLGGDASMNAPVKRGRTRPVPAEYRDKYYSDPKYAGIAESTRDAWAMLEYLDHGLGKIFDYLEKSPLRNNTYVMIGGDNGSALLDRPERQGKLLRMPGKMEGYKSLVMEGGIRNCWAVQGPGVEAGVVDSTLLTLADVLPTVADLAGANLLMINHEPWDGASFANLLSSSNSSSAHVSAVAESPPSVSADYETGNSTGSSAAGYRGTSLATPQQLNRFVYALGTQCWDFDAVPELGPDRDVIRPQPLFDFDTGGEAHSLYRNQYNSWLPKSTPNDPGFQACMAVRYKEYKWVGLTNKVYRFNNGSGSHIELPCNEVAEPEASQLRTLMSSAARSWWASVAAGPNSFTKPISYLGLGKWNVTNVLPQGAKERTPGSVTMLPNGVSGFVNTGDRICMNIKVMRPGSYEVVFFYTSYDEASFKLSVGPYADITDGSAPISWFILPAQKQLKGMSIGLFSLPVTGDTRKHEACLELVQGSSHVAPIFHMLANIQFTWTSPEMIYPLPEQPHDNTVGSLDPAVPVIPSQTPGGAVAPDHPEQDVPDQRQDNSDPDGTYTGQDEHMADSDLVKLGAGALSANTTQTRPSASTAVSVAAAARQHARPGKSLARAAKQEGRQGRPRAFKKAVPASGLDLSGKYSWLKDSLPGDAEQGPNTDDWTALRHKFGWPDGQKNLEGIYTPYDQEDIHDCPVCHPRV